MGGHASRDALDLDLVRSEFEILQSRLSFIGDIKEYGRMVDNINTVIQGDFGTTVKLILLMSKTYPTMPLNIQLSFCYSRFLDVHIYNVFTPKNPKYSLYTTLAWKESNSLTQILD